MIDNDSTFSDGDNIYDNANLGATATTCTIENQLPPDNYWWKVCATNAEGDNWSENTWTFEITPLGIPTVTTQAATDIGATTATGNGNITDTGGETCDERGVEWGTSTGSYPNSHTDTNGFGTGAFTKGMTGLPSDITIYYRAKAHNSAGWGYGDEQSFLTKSANVAPNIPTNLQPTGVQTTTSVTISCVGIDNDGDDMNVHFYDNSDDSLIDNIWIENGQTAEVIWSPLVRGNTYTFFAGAQDDNGNWGENSDTQTFTVNMIPIAENQKAEELTTFTPTLSWDYFDADGDTQENFHVQVGTSENASDLWDSNQQNSDSHTTYAGSALDEDVIYHWRVRVYDGYEWSDWLYGGTFTISPPIPPERWEIPDPVLLVMLTLVLMVLAMAFDSPILAVFGGISSIFVGLLLLDTLWVGSIFLGLGMYFMLTAVLSEWED